MGKQSPFGTIDLVLGKPYYLAGELVQGVVNLQIVAPIQAQKYVVGFFSSECAQRLSLSCHSLVVFFLEFASNSKVLNALKSKILFITPMLKETCTRDKVCLAVLFFFCVLHRLGCAFSKATAQMSTRKKKSFSKT
jgi:hypothetical protein